MSQPLNSELHHVLVPREIVNADSVYVVSWSVDDGASVQEGADLCTIETSKAAVAVAAPASGIARHRAPVGAEVAIGGILGFVTSAIDTPLPEVTVAAADAPATISPKALRKMEELGLDPALFAGRGLIRERDVVEMAEARKAAASAPAARAPFRVQVLGPVQRRVAATMELGARIPVSHLSREVDMAAIRTRAVAVSRELKTLVSPVDLLVQAVARAALAHGIFNAEFDPDAKQAHVFEAVHVGVALDIDQDLYVIVVKDADTRGLKDVATDLRRLQMAAGKRLLTPADLTGATITVTSMLGRGVHHFQPILPPGQTAIVALSDTRPGSDLADLSLTFDHRVANGSGAAAFLNAIDREWRGDTA